MSTQSGCDPRAAVEATLRHLLVDLPSVTTSPMTGRISIDLPDMGIEVLATETHYDEGVLVIDKAEPIATWRVAPAIEERMREVLGLDPNVSIHFQRDPGDETAA